MEPFVLPYGATFPRIDPTAWIAPTATIIGDTHIAADCTVLFGCVLRGDIHRVEVGAGSNIQDLSLLHVADDWPCIIGCEVTAGHCALLHGCVVEDGCLIGMHATLLNGCVIGRGSVVAAGCVVPEGLQVPPGSIVAGVPGKIRGEVTARMLKKLGATEAVANTDDIPPELRGLPGVPFARKYRLVGKAYRSGRAYRPNEGREP
jgi:carbonic anhydrase/acetyltransferase-like protein (isoleucine patch superfamily)